MNSTLTLTRFHKHHLQFEIVENSPNIKNHPKYQFSSQTSQKNPTPSSAEKLKTSVLFTKATKTVETTKIASFQEQNHPQNVYTVANTKLRQNHAKDRKRRCHQR